VSFQKITHLTDDEHSTDVLLEKADRQYAQRERHCRSDDVSHVLELPEYYIGHDFDDKSRTCESADSGTSLGG
jgi:hypothetical protein